MADLVALKAANANRWANAKLTRGPEFKKFASKAVANKARYQDVEARTGVHWVFVAVTHYRESSMDFTTHLGQGDPLSKKTTHVPAGRGPFLGPKAFEDGAVDALVNCAPYAARNKDWSIASMLTYLERYNGLAYANAGRPSPYIWSGTDQYTIGKVLVDHGPIVEVVDKQLGCAGLILSMIALDPSITFDAPIPAFVLPPAPVAQSMSPAGALDGRWLQASLNALGATPVLVVDGIVGAGTRNALRAFQTTKKLSADGLAGPKTIAAIKAALATAPALAATGQAAPVVPAPTNPTPQGASGKAAAALLVAGVSTGAAATTGAHQGWSVWAWVALVAVVVAVAATAFVGWRRWKRGSADDDAVEKAESVIEFPPAPVEAPATRTSTVTTTVKPAPTAPRHRSKKAVAAKTPSKRKPAKKKAS